MPKFRVKERQARWITHIHEVTADSEEDARDLVANEAGSGAIDIEEGDFFGDCTYEVTQLADPPPPKGRLATSIERVRRAAITTIEQIVHANSAGKVSYTGLNPHITTRVEVGQHEDSSEELISIHGLEWEPVTGVEITAFQMYDDQAGCQIEGLSLDDLDTETLVAIADQLEKANG